MTNSEAADPVALQIAAWSSSLKLDDVPSTVLERARELILDGLGVAIAAADEPLVGTLRDWIGARSRGHEPVLFADGTYTARDAALVNGALMHALDFDDFGYGGHATCVVLPAVLANVARCGITGRELLTAYVVGMEVFGRLASSSTAENVAARGWHPTSVYGGVAATVAVARSLGLSDSQTAHALTIAASSGAGLVANFGSSVKPLHAGMAAAAAITATELASAGLDGNLDVLDADQGFGHAFAGGLIQWDEAVSNLGAPFRLQADGPSIKQYPCCGGNHRIIENLRRIMTKLEETGESVAEVTVHVAPGLLHVLRYPSPETPNEAKFSAQFSVAATLIHGTCDMSVYTETFLQRPDLSLARARVNVVDDLVGPREHVAVEVIDTKGIVHVEARDDLLGSPKQPMSLAQIEAKFHANAAATIDVDLQDSIAEDVRTLDRSVLPWSTWNELVAASRPAAREAHLSRKTSSSSYSTGRGA